MNATSDALISFAAMPFSPSALQPFSSSISGASPPPPRFQFVRRPPSFMAREISNGPPGRATRATPLHLFPPRARARPHPPLRVRVPRDALRACTSRFYGRSRSSIARRSIEHKPSLPPDPGARARNCINLSRVETIRTGSAASGARAINKGGPGRLVAHDDDHVWSLGRATGGRHGDGGGG